jgi:hypothetical protein
LNSGAFHQFHTALLLLAELYATPEHHLEDRTWKCLDYVFELPATLNRGEKARKVLGEIQEKALYYQSVRRYRVSIKPEDEVKESVALAPQQASVSPARTHLTSESRHSDPIPSSTEFRNFATTVTEHQFYNPAMIPRAGSPPSSDTSSMINVQQAFPAGPSAADMMMDIDWVCDVIWFCTAMLNSLQNEWDKLFPSDSSFGDSFGDLNLPDLVNFPATQSFGLQYPQRGI